MSAYRDVMEMLGPDEVPESVVFGDWGWGGYGEGDSAHQPIPAEKRGVVIPWDDAMPLMERWSFLGGYGAPDCYAAYIWTNERVLWVTQHDGSTDLDSAPRHPIDIKPGMPGG